MGGDASRVDPPVTGPSTSRPNSTDHRPRITGGPARVTTVTPVLYSVCVRTFRLRTLDESRVPASPVGWGGDWAHGVQRTGVRKE